MKVYEEDLNNWTDFKSCLLDTMNEEHMKRLANIITERPLVIGSTFINSDETNAISYNTEEKAFEFFSKVEEGLYKSLYTVKIKTDDIYVYVEEDCLVQGFAEDEEGNTVVADVVGIKVDFVESTEYDFEYKEEDYISIDEDSVYSEFYQCNNYMQFEKVEEEKYIYGEFI